ncbi:hypothetical protein BCR34DRAFT_628497 [Clohesyomyces aquaticus]|uniref:Nephrocystin 3-like N-terminal domain-containing protein n=1 Tax=Clohesyomyces aquaticus TaxID=1231657 RepID=A0A1Y1YIV4_9PLEO|nr:hypothetical protein BCR34DRAFT_628497 [Clohesyomyces aquaticus]
MFRSKGRLPSFSSSRTASGSPMMKSMAKRMSATGSYKIGFVQESAISLQKRSMGESGAGVYHGISDVSYINFLEWIRSERLTTLPHKGSKWDKVLIRALYFAEQLNRFDLLLELGHDNSDALDKASSRSELLAATSKIREQLCLLYTDLLSFVVDVATKFYKTVNGTEGMTSVSVSFDIFEIFDDTIDTFQTRQETWLAPRDRVLASLNRGHSTFVDQQAEFTCIWFQKPPSRFIQTDSTFMLVTSQPGAGKTTLAGTIVERLKRPMNRKQFDTLFCSLAPDIQSTAISIAVVKMLLYQFLNLRVGNMAMYYALYNAYHQCRLCADLTHYENHLWQALSDTLKQHNDEDGDIVIVVDGLVEIASSQSASIQSTAADFDSASLIDRLAEIASQSRGVKLVALSSSAKKPSQANVVHQQVTTEDVRDDLHAVALRALIDNHHFHSRPASEQETLLDSIIESANGSFLWTIVACEILNSQKSDDAVKKTAENLVTSKPSVKDLVLKLFAALNITQNAKTLLSWILAAERPLTTEEINTLFTVDVQRATLTDKGVNVHEVIQAIQPLLTVHDGILAHQNKIPIPLKESEADLLLRVLTYAKFTLSDKGEGTMDNTDTTIADQLKKALPDTTILPILEQLSWDSELPIPQAVTLHKLVGHVRRFIFTENHPAVLQGYLAVCTKISQKILSDVHPLTLECATQFLIMTQREEVLVILISAYQRQYGSSSEIVIRTRQILAEHYNSLKEEDRAQEVYRLIQDATIQQYGPNSRQAQEVQGRLSVVLGKGRGDRQIDAYKESFFHQEDEVDTEEAFDIISIEIALAEQAYVELWMEISSNCRTLQSVEWHEKNIAIATKYSQFLRSQNRTTEASAVLTYVWQQYQHHQLSFSENILSKLTTIAKELKTMGSYTMALSIFKYAGSFYQNSRQEESHISRQINQQVSETSTQLVKQSLASSSSTTETTTTISESVFQDVFFSVIKSSKTIDSSTIALAKKLTTRHVEQRNWSAAISVIQATLQRTWSSFLSSIHDVTMTSTFTQESIELVERLAECHMHPKQMEKVEDTYSRYFRAVLVTPNVDKALFEKATVLLIDFYDKHGYADNAISVFQEILVAYRTRLGPTHELAIQTLYTLARRCHNHPRKHPYWIEYYLQIITNLNKGFDVCHKDALYAVIVVTTTYWQDRRYAEAVTIYRVLFNTFVRKTNEHKAFSDTEFQYRETCIATFGAESTISTEATLSLAQVAQRSEEHASQAIALYEEVSKSSKTITTRTSVAEIKQALSSLYVRQMQSANSYSFNAETIDRAVTVTQEQFTESTGNPVRELAILYHRKKKTDLAVKKLTTAVSEIVSKERSSQKMIESAASIASSFVACEQTSTAHSLVRELHRQICARDARYSSKWSFDLTKSNRSALAFIASLQYNLCKDASITFAEIMANLNMEYMYFERFRRTLQSNASMADVLLAAAPLRWFLRRHGEQEMITFVEEQAVALFVKHDANDLNILSKESPRIFIVGILGHLGNGRNKNFNRSVILASNESVLRLTKPNKFPEAYDIANLGFLYASKRKGYNGPGAISMGFKLASLLVGRDGEICQDAGLRKKMLELSNRIVRKILEILQLYELSHLSVLLGEQEDYELLEWLLTTLWNTRDAQRSWPAKVFLNLGRHLICARYLAGHPVKAMRLCEDIAYSMRCAHGPRAPITIETYELLTQLDTSTAQTYQAEAASEKTDPLAQQYFKKAFGVHEDILRLLVHENGTGDDSDDEEGISVSVASADGKHSHTHTHSESLSAALDADSVDESSLALRHLHLLKLAFQRLGNWPKPYEEYGRLNAQIFRVFGGEGKWKGVQGTEEWSAKEFGGGEVANQDSGFESVHDWALGREEDIAPPGEQIQNGHTNGNGTAKSAN